MLLFWAIHFIDSVDYTQEKNKRRNPVRLEIPIVPELARIIDCSPVRDRRSHRGSHAIQPSSRALSLASFENISEELRQGH